MSDLFDTDGQRREALAAPAGIWDRAGARGRYAENQQQRAEWQERYNLELTDEEFRVMDFAAQSMQADQGSVEEYSDAWLRMGTAMKLSRMNGLPFEFAYANLDHLMASQYPQAEVPKHWYRVVSDHYQLGENTKRMAGLAWYLRAARGDAQRMDAIWRELQALDAENEGLYDSVPRGLIMEGLKVTAESIPISVGPMAARMLGSLVHPAVGFLAGAAASAADMAGLEFYSLLKEGIPFDRAWNAAVASGVVQGVLEQASGPEAMLAGTGAGIKLFKRLHFAGAFGAFAKALGAQAAETLGEGVTEWAQEWTSIAASEGAKARTERETRAAAAGGGAGIEAAAEALATAAYREYAKMVAEENPDALLPRESAAMKNERAWQAFKGGFLASAVTGVLTVPHAAAVSMADTLRVNHAAAVSETEEEFAENTKGTYAEEMPELRKQLWEHAQQRRGRDEAARAEELRKERLYEAVSQRGQAERDAQGRLRAENERLEESDGTVTGLYAVGDTDAGGAYEEAVLGADGKETGESRRVSGAFAAIAWEQRGGTVEVTGFGMSPNLQADAALREEVFKGFATDMGQPVSWQGQTFAPGEVAADVRRFGFDDNAAPRRAANEYSVRQKANIPSSDSGEGTAAKTFRFDRRQHTAADTRADTDAKAAFRRQVAAAGTAVQSDAQLDAVVGFYDEVGRKWFNSGFADFMRKLTASPENFVQPYELTDEQVSGWYQNSLGAEEMAARGIDPHNLTDAQKQLVRENLRGATVAGLDGLAASIRAAEGADVSTFVHEGVHAFTLLAKQADGELYSMLMDAAGLGGGRLETASEREIRDAYEKLSYDMERYLKTGEAPAGASAQTRGLFAQLKEFLQAIARIVAGDLSPDTKALFDELFSGKEGQDGAREAQAQKDTAGGHPAQWRAAMEQSGANEGQAATGPEPELEIYSDNRLDRIIRDAGRPLEERSEAAVLRAGEAYADALLDRRDRAHRPTAELIKRAMRIPGAAERERVIAAIRELRGRYAGTAAEFKAPNGKGSNLNPAQWYAVRTPGFKKWFGDWERAARVALLEKTPDITLDINAYKGKYELNAESIKKYLKENVQKQGFINRGTGEKITLSGRGIDKITSHGMRDEVYMKSIAHIPAIIENAIFIAEETAYKPDTPYENYKYYVAGIMMDDKNYTVRSIIGERDGEWYYDHYLTEQKKEGLIDTIGINTPGHQSASSTNKDTVLPRILQAPEVSKAVDENGEPLVVYHGTNGDFEAFDQAKARAGQYGEGFYFTPNRETARNYGDRVIAAFINARTDRRDEKKTGKERDHLRTEDGTDFWIVKNPEQVKSAEGNAGTYGAGSPLILYQDAWHGSPYRFVRFDSFYIGAGEGAQAYGWGHYFSSRREIAEWYKEELTGYHPPLTELNGGEQEKILAIAEEAGLARFITGGDGDLDIAALQGWIEDSGNDDFYQQLSQWLGSEQKAQEILAENGLKELLPGQLYQVGIPDNSEMLDWDKRLLDSPEYRDDWPGKLEAVRENGRAAGLALDGINLGMTGEEIYRDIQSAFRERDVDDVITFMEDGIVVGTQPRSEEGKTKNAARAASKLLARSGFSGIRYLDGGSRAAGEGSYNYVVFSDGDITIEQTFYQDDELAAFINNFPEAVRDAAGFDSGEDLANYLAAFGGIPQDVLEKARAARYFDEIYRAAKEGRDTLAGGEFRQAAQDALANKRRRGEFIHAGNPAAAFVQKGVAGLPYKVSPAVIRKATQNNYNDHCVSAADIERLPELLASPVMLLKSLTAPGSFVAVLDALDEKGRPVIAVVRPGDGFNSIPSVYGRENFADFIRRADEAGAVLSVNRDKKITIGGVDLATVQFRGGATYDGYQLPLQANAGDLSSPNPENLPSPDRAEARPQRGVSMKAALAAVGAYGVTAAEALEAADIARGRDDLEGAARYLEGLGVPRPDAESYARAADRFGHGEYVWLKNEARSPHPTARLGARPGAKLRAMFPQPRDAGARRREGSGGRTETRPPVPETAFAESLLDGAKEIHEPGGAAQGGAATGRGGRTADAFREMLGTDEGFDDVARGFFATLEAGPERGMTDEETARNARAHQRVQATAGKAGLWRSAYASLRAGKPINGGVKEKLRSMMKALPLQYMEAYALASGDDSWLPGETDIAKIKRLDTGGLLGDEYLERLSPHELQAVSDRLKDQKVREKFEAGTLRYDDRDLEAYDRMSREKNAEIERGLKRLGAEFEGQRELVARLDENVRLRRALAEQAERENAGRRAEGELRPGDETAARKARRKLGEAQAAAERERLQLAKDIDKLGWAARENFRKMEALLNEREAAALEARAIEEARKELLRNFRAVVKAPDRKSVHTEQARALDWVRSHFDSYTWIAKSIGPRARSVKELHAIFATEPAAREELKTRLAAAGRAGVYEAIERAAFKADGSIRPWGEIPAADKRLLRRHLVDSGNIFEEVGIDVEADPPAYGAAQYAAIREQVKDRFPPALLSKLGRLREAQAQGGDWETEMAEKDLRLRDFTLEDMRQLADICNGLRKEGRAAYQARREARAQIIREERERFLAQVKKFLPEKIVGNLRAVMPGSGDEKLAEEKRSWRHLAYALINARRFFRMLEGGEDDVLYYAVTRREYAAFEEENRHAHERYAKAEAQLKAAGIDLKALGKTKFEVEGPDGETVRLTLDEFISVYYSQYNERAKAAVAFGDFASQTERDAIGASREALGRGAEGLTPEALLRHEGLEAAIMGRYSRALRQFEKFLAQEGNGQYRALMDIIGRDFDENYGRLQDFVADEYNIELGSEPYYMPLSRLSAAAKENTDAEAALAEHGLSRYISKGFSKNRIDILPEHQAGVRLGFYETWNEMVRKQEHLMAYDGLMREMEKVFFGQGSEGLRDALEKGHGGAAVDYVRKFVSELAKPEEQNSSEALRRVTRLVRGHYSAAVLGWRVSSILKQALQSPPPFFLHVNPREYYAAMMSCLDEKTRKLIKERSVYLKVRYFDPAAAMVKEMSRLAMSGQLGNVEMALSRIEQKGMTGQEWIDAVAVMPGWLAAYRRKLAELERAVGDLRATAKAAGVSEEVLLGAELIGMAEKAWGGDKAAAKVNFAPSEKLRGEIEKLAGHGVEKITVTDSDIRHIKKEHGQNEAGRGQVDITPEDIALIPLVMNEFDSAKINHTITAKDGEQLNRLEFRKQINGTAYVATIERRGGGKTEQVISLWKTRSKAANAADAASIHTSGTRIASAETIQRAEALRNSKKTVGGLEFMTPEMAEAEAIAYADQVVRDCQPSSVAMDQIPLLRDLKRNPLGAALGAFQNPMAVIFQNLFVDAPNDFKHGRVLHGLWTFALYGGLAALTAALFQGFGGGDDDKPLGADIGFSAAMGLVESVPVLGGDISFQVENFYRTGKLRVYGGSDIPAADSLARAANAVSDGDWQKGLQKATDALFYLTGLPAGLKQEAERSYERGDITPLLGNRRRKE